MMSSRLYLVSLLVLSSLWRGGLALPVARKGPLSETCVSYAQGLLQSITEVLSPENHHLHKSLFEGIRDCSKYSDVLNMTDTVSACAPLGTRCSGASKSHFDQELCVRSIGEDLLNFYSLLSAHPDPDGSLSSTNILLKLRELMTNCFPLTVSENVKESASTGPDYNERQALCQNLTGFQIRSVTINRALGYMLSGEHNQ